MPRRTSPLPTVLFYLMTALTAVVLPSIISLKVLDPGLLPRFLTWAGGLGVIAAIASWHLLRNRVSTHGLFRHPLAWFALLYLIMTGTGFLVALNLDDWVFSTLRTSLGVVHMLLFALILLWTPDRWRHLAYAISGAGLVIATLGLLQWAGDIFVFSRSMETPFGTMMHQNLFASWLFLTFPMSLFGLVRTKGFAKLFFATAALFILAAIVVSTTRSVWAATTLGAALAGLAYVVVDKKLSIETIGRTGIQKRVVAIIVFAILLSASVAFLFVVSDGFDDIQERTMIWKKTAQLAVRNPVIGLGAGNWVAHTNIENMRSQITKSNWVRPHNDPLWVAAETGFPGLIGYLGMYLTAMFLLLLVIRRSTDPEHKWMALLALFGLIGFMLNSNSSFPRERIEHSSLAMTYVGISYALFRTTIPAAARAHRRAWVAGLGFAAAVPLAAFAIVVGVYRFEGETHVRRAHVLMSAKQWRQALHEVDKAYQPFYSAHANGLTLDYMRGICNYELKRYRESIKDFTRARAQNHKHIMNVWYIGRAQLHLGEYEHAVESFEECLRWWPNNKFTLPGIALAEYRLGHYENAFRHLNRFRKIIHEDRQASSYDDLWRAINARVGEERAAELAAEDTWEPRGKRFWRQNR